MAEAGASATKIVGCQMVNADSFGVSLHGIPDYVGCHSLFLPSPILRESSEHLAFSHSCVVDPNIYETFTPRRHRHRSSVVLPSRPYRRSPSGFPSIAADPIVSSRFPSAADRIRAAVRSLPHLFCRAGCLGKRHSIALAPDRQLANCQSSAKRLTPLTRRIPIASSGLNQPLSAASSANRRIAERLRLIVAADRESPQGTSDIELRHTIKPKSRLRAIPSDELFDGVFVGSTGMC